MAMGKAMCEKLSKYKEKYGLGNPEYQDGI
jgi:hypothetical protein